ncbi:hypothetical protein Efla_005179 [Eimeria flavescens]
MSAETKETKHGFFSGLLPGWLKGRRCSKCKGKPEAEAEKNEAEEKQEATPADKPARKWDYRQHGADWAPPVISCNLTVKRQSPIEVDPEALQRLLDRCRNGDPAPEEKTATGNLMRLGTPDMLLSNHLASAAPAGKDQVTYEKGFKLEFSPLGEGAFGLLKRGQGETVETYRVLQFHFHAPAEHTFGQRDLLELHIVCARTDIGREDQSIVLGLFFNCKDGESDCAFLKSCEAAFLGFLKTDETKMKEYPEDMQLALQVAEQNTEGVAAPRVDLQSLFSPDELLITYEGSLTTPPCTENVVWYVVRTPLISSEEQLKRFQLYLESGEGDKRRGNCRRRQNLEAINNDQPIYVLAPDLPPAVQK